MKRILHILFLAFVMAACTPAVETHHGASHASRHLETRHGTSLPDNMMHQQLQAIDSLMWQQPDSALAVMLDFAASPRADSLSTFDGHYFHILLSELLYKNDYGQSNREELLKAVDYFDSLTLVLNDSLLPRSRHCGLGPQSPGQNDNLVFLDARAHYINGVGFYERDSVVEACTEYLKALKVMESHFKEKDLLKNKAKFMAYTYNRLGDMFSGQFMMENAISCYEKSLVYCKIEPISSQSVSNIFFLIGKQYDKMNEIDKARLCYEQALGRMKNSDNLLYRDVFFCKTVCDYQVGKGLDKTMDELRQIVVQADDEKERLNRFLTIGAIFKEEGIYDSALYYFDFVFQYEKDMVVKMRAAESMRSIYDKLGDKEKYDECLHFLASQKKTEGENKALVSQLDNLVQDYLKQKQEKLSEAEHAKHIRKIVGIIVPIAVLLALAIIIVAKLRSKKLLRQEMEKQRQAHQAQQNALSGRLKQSNQEIRELKEQIKQQDDLSAKAEAAPTFAEEPICRLIVERVKDGQFLSQMDCKLYKDYALDKQQLMDLRLAADRHFNQFTVRLKQAYPKLTNGDLDYCCLYLLGLTDADVSALMQKAYPTISQRSRKIKSILGSDSTLPITLRDFSKCNL